jgi:hypothetical protein
MDHMREIYSTTGVSTERLDKSRHRYGMWREKELKQFRRRRSLRSSTLEAKTHAMIRSDEFGELIANEKLGRFFAKLVRENRVFDYRTREQEENQNEA